MHTQEELLAIRFAYARHIGQKRKYTGRSYISHPAAVVETLRTVPNHTVAMLCGGWMHDLVEDTDTTLAEISSRFGEHVACIVYGCTNISTTEDGNRQQRKAKDRAHNAAALPESQTIKVADAMDNVPSILLHDPVFARTYVPEKILLLQDLKEADRWLWQQAWAMLNRAADQLRL